MATLEGYSVEGGLDVPGAPATCFAPTIALRRHAGHGDGAGLWRGYEEVIDVAAGLGVRGIALGVEWARVEPRRGAVDEGALARYARAAAHARSLSLDVTAVLVDAAWPAWLGLEAWLLPWVVPYYLGHAARVAAALPDARLVAFADARGVVERGFVEGTGPPWRRGARQDAARAHAQVERLTGLLADDPRLGARVVARVQRVDAGAAAAAGDAEEVHVRTLVRGAGPTAARVGVLERSEGRWAVADRARLLGLVA
jgi:hypothetical protein